jgi:ribosomal protein S18 acetylase RimI-like enzyme
MLVGETPVEFELQEIYLHPDHQGRGIGSCLIRELLAKAQHAAKPVSLSVLKVNTRARRLYERLGFRKAGESETHYVMRAGNPELRSC